jgi:hypothetical protein
MKPKVKWTISQLTTNGSSISLKTTGCSVSTTNQQPISNADVKSAFYAKSTGRRRVKDQKLHIFYFKK